MSNITKKQKELVRISSLTELITKRLQLSLYICRDPIGISETYEWKVIAANADSEEMEVKGPSLIKCLNGLLPVIRGYFKESIATNNYHYEFECAAWCKRAIKAIDRNL